MSYSLVPGLSKLASEAWTEMLKLDDVQSNAVSNLNGSI